MKINVVYTDIKESMIILFLLRKYSLMVTQIPQKVSLMWITQVYF